MNILWEQTVLLLFHDSTAFRAFIPAFALTFVLTPPEPGRKGICVYLLRLALTFLSMLAISILTATAVIVFRLPLYLYVLSDFIRALVVGTAYALFFCRYPTFVKSAMSGSIVAVTGVCANLCYSLGHTIDSYVTGMTIPVMVAIFGLLAAFALFMNRYSIMKVGELPRFGAVLLITINSLAIFTTLANQLLETAIYLPSEYSSIVYAVLLMLIFFSYLSIYFICAERNQTEKFRMENQMLRAGAEQIAMSRSNLQDLRQIRHDLKNSYTYMSALLSEGKYEELAKLLEAHSPARITPEFYVDCGNADISAILTVESSKAHAKGFRLVNTLVVPPTLPFEGGELFSILSNLIDNAIESNIRYGLTDDITVQINLRGEYLYICVTNRLPPQADAKTVLELKTHKQAPDEHGLGLQIVRRLAKKYNGYFLADVDNQRFVAEVLIDMMYKEAENQ